MSGIRTSTTQAACQSARDPITGIPARGIEPAPPYSSCANKLHTSQAVGHQLYSPILPGRDSACWEEMFGALRLQKPLSKPELRRVEARHLNVPRGYSLAPLAEDIEAQWGIKLPAPIKLGSIVTQDQDGAFVVSHALIRAVSPVLTQVCVCQWVPGPSMRLGPVELPGKPRINAALRKKLSRPEDQVLLSELLWGVASQFLRCQWVYGIHEVPKELSRSDAARAQAYKLSEFLVFLDKVHIVAIRKGYVGLGVWEWVAQIALPH